MSNYIAVTLVLKDGGFEVFQMTPKMIGDLAKAIKEKGSETVITETKDYEVCGIFIKGNITVPGIIMIGKID